MTQRPESLLDSGVRLAKAATPQAYKQPLRFTARDVLTFAGVLVVAAVVLVALDKQIPPWLENLLSLMAGYAGARIFKQ